MNKRKLTSKLLVLAGLSIAILMVVNLGYLGAR